MIPCPVDHLPQSLRDADCLRREAEKERRITLYRQARRVSSALRTVVHRQPKGGLTRAEGEVLDVMIRGNLIACVRKRRQYRPTRARIAKATGYTQRTVSACLTRLKAAGIIVPDRYAKGGRNGHKGHGLATEWRAGCLQFICDQLEGLGYVLPVGLKADLIDLARWAALQVGESTETKADHRPSPKPTGKKPLTNVMLKDRAALRPDPQAPVDPDEPAPRHDMHAPPDTDKRLRLLSNDPDASTPHKHHLSRPALGTIAEKALRMVPMPGSLGEPCTVERAVLFTLRKNPGGV